MFGDQPRGLPVLFFTEMWERFSYYGMRALLILFMTAAVAEGGLGLETGIAAAIYGLYTFGVYAMALPGGWIADKLIGQRRAVLIGGIIIALGHYTLALPMLWSFYLGLSLVVIGTGLLKPNVSAIVGELYPEGGARRDAGFSIFYMGINVGAILGQSVCALLGEKVDWHLGFGAAAIGMTFGIIQYVAGKKHIHNLGELKGDYAKESSIKSARKQFTIGIGFVLALLIAFVLYVQGSTSFDIVSFAENLGLSITAIAFIYFAVIIIFVCKNSDEKKRVGLIAVLFLGAALFWSGFEQAGSSMNLFARDLTDRMVFGWEVPAGWLQSINPLFIVILAPVMGMLWVRLGDKNPNIPIKFGIALVLLGVGFFVLAWGASFIEAGKVSPMWLIVTYFFHTVGELCLSPVGLSSITKLSPDRLVGQMMGTWFMGTALGNLIAGLVAGYIETLPQNELYAVVAAIVMVSGFIFLLIQKPINKLSCGIK